MGSTPAASSLEYRRFPTVDSASDEPVLLLTFYIVDKSALPAPSLRPEPQETVDALDTRHSFGKVHLQVGQVEKT